MNNTIIKQGNNFRVESEFMTLTGKILKIYLDTMSTVHSMYTKANAQFAKASGGFPKQRPFVTVGKGHGCVMNIPM